LVGRKGRVVVICGEASSPLCVGFFLFFFFGVMLDVDILFVQLSFVQLIHLSMKNAALQRFLRNNIKDNSKSESSTNVTYIQKSSVYNPSFLNKMRINNKPIKIKTNKNLESQSRHNIAEMTQDFG
jgi:hypothetical protein